MISSISSAAHRLGTSPVLRILLISSRKPSLTIYVSLKRKTTGVFLAPAVFNNFFKSSFHD